MRISDVLKGKARQDVVTIPPTASVRELAATLAEHNIGAVVVSRDGSTLEGIVSERDIVRRMASDPQALDATVAQIASTALHTCEADDAVIDLAKVMTEHRVRHVPVLTGGVLTGVVSIGDVVKHRIDELEFERDQLDQYVRQS